MILLFVILLLVVVVLVFGFWIFFMYLYFVMGFKLVGDDIEMDFLVFLGYCCWWSSLINFVNVVNNCYWLLYVWGYGIDELKILEEGSLGEFLWMDELDVELLDEDFYDDEEIGLMVKEWMRKKKKRICN